MVDAKDTCEFYTPEDWIDDINDSQETDSRNIDDTQEEASFEHKIPTRADQRQVDLKHEHHRGRLDDHEPIYLSRDNQVLYRENGLHQTGNVNQQTFNKALRQPSYGAADPNWFQGYQRQQMAQNVGFANEHQEMAHAMAKEKGIKYNQYLISHEIVKLFRIVLLICFCRSRCPASKRGYV